MPSIARSLSHAARTVTHHGHNIERSRATRLPGCSRPHTARSSLFCGNGMSEGLLRPPPRANKGYDGIERRRSARVIQLDEDEKKKDRDNRLVQSSDIILLMNLSIRERSGAAEISFSLSSTSAGCFSASVTWGHTGRRDSERGKRCHNTRTSKHRYFARTAASRNLNKLRERWL